MKIEREKWRDREKEIGILRQQEGERQGRDQVNQEQENTRSQDQETEKKRGKRGIREEIK